MMVAEVLAQAKKAGISFYLENEKLAFKGPKGAMTASLKEKIIAVKSDLVDLLAQTGATIQGPTSTGATRAPLSLQQRSQFALYARDPMASNYHIALIVNIAKSVSLETLVKCLSLTFSEQELFRTRFSSDHQGVSQYMVNEPSWPISFDERPTSLESWSKECFERPFLLEEQFAYRVRITQDEDGNHVVLFVVHHIILDGWSIKLVVENFERSLLHLVENLPWKSTKPSLNYFDYAIWQQSEVGKKILNQGITFWQNHLNTAPKIHNLPMNGEYAASSQGRRLNQVLSDELTLAVQEFAVQYKITPYLLFHTIFAITIGQFSRCNDLIIGVPVANRPWASVEAIVGHFVNSIPTHVVWQRSNPILELLQERKHTYQQELANQSVPFEMISKAVIGNEALDHHPLFQIMFSFQNEQLSQPATELIQIPAFSLDVTSAKFDLQLDIIHGKCFDLSWQFNQEKISPDLVESINQVFQHAVSRLLTKPTSIIADLVTLPIAQEKQLAQWNNTQLTFPSGRLTEHFHFGKTTPKALALRDENNAYSYAQFDALRNQWGHVLQRQGVKANMLVALYLPRSTDMVVALHGVWQAGGAYLPLDIAHPRARIAQILADAKPQCVITTMALAKSLPSGVEVIAIDDEVSQKARLRAPTSAPEVQCHEQDSAYVIYTSGSTGQPKGVVVSHRALANRIDWMQRQYPLTQNDVVIQKTPYTFDVSVWELVWPFFSGASLSVAKEGGHKSPQYLCDFMIEQKVSIAHFVPSMLTAMLAYGDLAQVDTLRHVFASGEALLGKTVEAFYQHVEHAKLHNLYGPTEAAIDVSYWSCSANDQEQVPIGRPIQNIQLHVLDSEQQVLPIGAIGELYIGGVGLAEGYLNQEELTAERFIDSAVLGQRLYKTGDLAHWRADGQLMYVGRSDFQVKLRGLRIELGEIEAQLLALEQVKEAAVIVASEQLVAYYVGDLSSEQQFKQALSAHLPAYMVPEFYINLAEMPLSVNGKLDRKALPELIIDSQHQGYVAPEGELEELVANTWQDVLGKAQVSRTDHFFSLGGDSISILQVVSALKQQGFSVELESAFKNLVLKDFAQLLKSKLSIQTLPLTTGQQQLSPLAMWYRGLAKENFNYFFQSASVKVPLTNKSLMVKNSVGQLLARHDALRLALTEQLAFAKYLQYDDDLLSTVFIELNSELEERALWLAFISKQASKIKLAWDLNQEPAFKAVLFKNESLKEQYLVFIVHHIAIDAVSWNILLQDLNAVVSGNKISVRHASYQQSFPAESLQTIASYFEFASKKIASKFITWQQKSRTQLVLNKVQLGKLQKNISHLEIAFNDLLLLSLAMSYQELLNKSQVVVDSESHGRFSDIAQIDNSDVIGWFTDINVLELTLNNDFHKNAFLSLYRLIKSQQPERSFNQGYWLNQKDSVLGQPRDLQLNYLGQISANTKQSSSPIVSLDTGSDIGAEFPLLYQCIVTASINEGQLQAVLDYDPTTLNQAQADELLSKTFYLSEKLSAMFSVESALVEKIIGQAKAKVPEKHIMAYVSDKQLLPTTPMQQALYIDCEASDQTDKYVTQTVLTFSGEVNLDTLTQAWLKTINKYPALRAKFWLSEDGELYQFNDLISELKIQDYRGLDLPIMALKSQQKSAKFALKNDRLIKFSLTKDDQQQEQLLITHHHILMDGWSFGLVMQDVMQCYQNLDVIFSEQKMNHYFEWLSNYDIGNAQHYWQEQLNKLETSTLLQRNEQSVKFVEQKLKFTKDETQNITDFCQRSGYSLNQYLQAVWGYVLSKLTNQTKVCFGQVVNGRPAELENSQSLVGLFINTVPKVIDLYGIESISDYISSVQDPKQLAAELLPLSSIQNLSENFQGQLFDSLFVFENYPVDLSNKIINGNETSLELLDIQAQETTSFPITLIIVPNSQISIKFQIRGELNISCDNLLSYVRQIACQFTRVKFLTDNIALPIAQEKQLAQWNNTQLTFPSGRLTEHFHFGKTTPKALALRDENNAYSYAQFDALRNQWGHVLQRQGVKANMLVALYLPRSTDMVVALHGVWQAGGAYLPLDIAHPRARIAQILADAKPQCVITTMALAKSLPSGVEVIAIDDEVSQKARLRAPTSAPEVQCHEQDSAYVIYTSGSTGQPKGVVVSHRALANRIDWMQRQYPLTQNDVVIQKTPYTFDVSVWELVWPFFSGASLSVAKEGGHKSPQYLCDFMIEQKVSIAHFVPSMLTAMLAYGDLAQVDTLRHVFASGEALLGKTVEAFYQHVEHAKLHNLYGPTEAAIDVSYWSCSANDQEQVPIGRPIQNIQLHVLDSEQQVLPIGAIGELYIGGVGLAEGYLNQEELTAERFIDSAVLGQRLYKTGDLAHWRADGQLMYVGRSDFQVKLRGLRIELGEIEAQLLALEQVKEAAVIVASEQLVAYYVGDLSSEQQFKQALSAHLPAYMVPEFYINLAEMPLSVNGKLDRKALPELIIDSQHQGYVAPEGELEELVANTWQDVLGKAQVSRTDHFFSLGGDSLLVLKVLAQLQKAIGISIPLSVLMANNSVANIAVELVTLKNQGAEQPLPRAQDAQLVPLTKAQERIWLVQQFVPSSTEYHMPKVLQLTGVIDAQRIEQAMQKVQAVHGALRTQLVKQHDSVVQRMGAVNLELNQINHLDSDEQLAETIKRIINKPFDLFAEYPVRVALLNNTCKEAILVIVMHHMFCDGLSIDLIAKSFEYYYAKNSDAVESSSAQYVDYALFSAQQSVDDSSLAKWWQTYLEQAPDCHDLIVKQARNTELLTTGESHIFELDKQGFSAFRSLAQQKGISVFHMLHSFISILLCKYSAQNDITVGSPMANRSHSQTANMVGLFLDIVAIRHQLDESLTVEQWLEKTAKNCLSAIQYGDFGFEKVVEVVNPNRGHHSPIFQIFINHLRVSGVGQDGSSGDFEIAELPVKINNAKYEVGFYCTEYDDKLVFNINYRSALFSRDHIVNLAQSLLLLIEQAVENPHRQISNLSLTNHTMHAHLEGRKSALKYDNITQWFNETVQLFGDQPAITFGSQTVSYQQLQHKACIAAQRLREYSPNVTSIMIACERSIESIALIIGAWYIGKVVIPIDVETPISRAEHVFNNSDAELLITQQHHMHFAELSKGQKVVYLSELFNRASVSNEPTEIASLNAQDTAYIVYTSGSTGKPKGVCGTHQGLVNRLQWMQESYPYQSATAVQITQVGFIRHLWETFLPLVSGKHVTLLDSTYYQKPEDFLNDLITIGCDRIVTTPTVVSSFCQYLKASPNTCKINYWFVSGEPFTAIVAKEAQALLPETTFVNLYGSTEVTSDVSSFELTQGFKKQSLPLGAPINNTEIYIVDSNCRVLPISAKGQIAISGRSLANGYYSQSQQTEKVFMHLVEQQEKVYLTGDYGYIDSLKQLQLLGRRDELINLGGFRVELNEVKHAMMQLFQVEDVCVLIKHEHEQEPYIAAYVASKELSTLRGQELADFLHRAKQNLNQWLPYYMLPKSIKILSRFPLSANGKIDKHSLDSIELEVEQMIEASTNMEIALETIICDLLSLPKINISQNFFELGGTSIKAAQLRNQLAEQFGFNLELTTIFRAANLATLASDLEALHQQYLVMNQIVQTEVGLEGEELIL